jgi:SAM-dependent methyltransferase
MQEKELQFYQNEIKKLGEWYQPIQFIPGALETPSPYSFSSTLHGIRKWNFILQRNVGRNLRGKKILDIGCSSGLYSLLCARAGAQIVGIELDSRAYQQALLTREIFSLLDGRDYAHQVEFINQSLMDFDWEKYGRFDAVIALNILYWIDTPYETLPDSEKQFYDHTALTALLKNIKTHSDSIIVQCDENKYDVRKRKGGSLAATDAHMTGILLKKLGFYRITVDKPLAPIGFIRTLLFKTPEVDLKHPLHYARPVLRAFSR